MNEAGLSKVLELFPEVKCCPAKVLGGEFCKRLYGREFENFQSQELSQLEFIKSAGQLLDAEGLWGELYILCSEILCAEEDEPIAVTVGGKEFWWIVGIKILLSADPYYSKI